MKSIYFIVSIAIFFLFSDKLLSEDDVWTKFPNYSKRKSNPTSDIFEYQNKIYFGSSSWGIQIFDDKNWQIIDDSSAKTLFPGCKMCGYDVKYLVAKNNYLYSATGEGLLVVPLNNYKEIKQYKALYPNDSVKAHNALNGVVVDLDSTIWFIGNSGDISKFENDTIINTSIPNPAKNAPWGSLIVDGQNNKWYIANTNAAIKFDGINFTRYDSTNCPLKYEEDFSRIFYSKYHDALFFATSNRWTNGLKNRILKFKNNKWEELPSYDSIENSDSIKIQNFCEDKNGNIYMSPVNSFEFSYFTLDRALVYTANKEWKKIELPKEYRTTQGHAPYYRLFVDSKNYLWFGRMNNDIYRLDLNKYNLTGVEDSPNFSLPNISIRSVKPNPSTESSELEFFCEPKFFSGLKVKLYNILGEEVRDFSDKIQYDAYMATAKARLELNDINKGYYILCVSSNGERRAKSIIIE